jgi:hypothetical protein
MVSGDGGYFRDRGNAQNCAVTRRPRISLTSWKYKLFRVLRKLTPDEEMWLVFFLASVLIVLVIWLIRKPP